MPVILALQQGLSLNIPVDPTTPQFTLSSTYDIHTSNHNLDSIHHHHSAFKTVSNSITQAVVKITS
jgi:hypothetical protein